MNGFDEMNRRFRDLLIFDDLAPHPPRWTHPLARRRYNRAVRTWWAKVKDLRRVQETDGSVQVSDAPWHRS